MRARFIGDPANGGEGAETLSAFGVDFTKGEWASVPSAAATKLSTNSHFEMDADGDGEADLDADALRAALDTAGVKYHPQLGHSKLKALYDKWRADNPPLDPPAES